MRSDLISGEVVSEYGFPYHRNSLLSDLSTAYTFLLNW
jgi:hypothetical protein